ncbi:hypothetical protein [Chitinophaga sp. S165]|uniref:hypothetical protein n=1 Tax=Chitinophaga sp. S165 TaxID=2135462 RepID=UPI000D70D7F2|nr:hypothetical protein [Chitinophaga sp. S165]PWV46121.1 hypothetical protein C7475_11123 [Chitinophaga sp. S165]
MYRTARRRKIRKAIITTLVAGPVIIFVIAGICKEFSLRNNHQITTGLITAYKYSDYGERKLSFHFNYEVDRKKYESVSGRTGVHIAFVDSFIGKRFPLHIGKVSHHFAAYLSRGGTLINSG